MPQRAPLTALQPMPAPSNPRSDGVPYATPYARELARQREIVLSELPSGSTSRVIRAGDLRTALEPLTEVSAPGRPTTVQAQLAMTELDVTRLQQGLRVRLAAGTDALTEPSLIPVIAHCAVAELLRHPAANAGYDKQTDSFRACDSVALVVSTESDGTPTRSMAVDAGTLSIRGLTEELARPTTATSPGTFTLADAGPRGMLMEFAPPPPDHACMLTVGVVTRRLAVVPDPDGGESIGTRSVVQLALSYDPRALDCGAAAGFLRAIRTNLEQLDVDAALRWADPDRSTKP